MKNIKKRSHEKGKFKTSESLSDPLTYKHPIFCFKYLDKKWGLDACNKELKVSFLEKVVSLSSETWQSLQMLPRHGRGYEKLDPTTSKIRCSLPKDVFNASKDKIVAFRYSGLRPFVAVKKGYVLHVVGIDHNFSMYNHGS